MPILAIAPFDSELHALFDRISQWSDDNLFCWMRHQTPEWLGDSFFQSCFRQLRKRTPFSYKTVFVCAAGRRGLADLNDMRPNYLV